MRCCRHCDSWADSKRLADASGLRAIQNENRASFRTLWRVALALGRDLRGHYGVRVADRAVHGQYSTLFRVMVAYHAIHALVIGYIMIRVYRNAAAYDAVHNWAVEAATKLWYFVVIAWIMFYLVLYII